MEEDILGCGQHPGGYYTADGALDMQAILADFEEYIMQIPKNWRIGQIFGHPLIQYLSVLHDRSCSSLIVQYHTISKIFRGLPLRLNPNKRTMRSVRQ